MPIHKNKVKLSIVIPSLNEEKYIGRLLTALSHSTFKDFEIIVVDGDSRDQTKKIVRSFSKNLNIHLTTQTKKGIGLARNTGAKKAKGDYILFLDSDVVVEPNFLETALAEFDKRYFEIASFTIKPLSIKMIDKIIHKSANVLLRVAQHSSPIAPGFCILCTKRIFNRVKGFDESIKFAEDVNFVERAAKLAKFGIIKKTQVFVSVRRLEDEGRKKFLGKYVAAGVYRKLIGEIRDDKLNYTFGKFK